MVLCHQFNPRADCEGNFVLQSQESLKCPSNIENFDCSQIAGRDHLKAKRARKFRCKSKRISALAQPRYLTPKHSYEGMSREKFSIEVVKRFEDKLPTRIKLLAFPKVRRLMSTRDEYRNILDKEWCDRFQKHIKDSSLTMYSRLANVQLPRKVRGKKWKKADWERHCEWLKKRAMPRVYKTPPAPKRKRVPIDSLDVSILTLSRPRNPQPKFRPFCGFESNVKASAFEYQISERVQKLSAPKVPKVDEDEDEDEVFVPFKVKPQALAYQLTERTKKLALPKPPAKSSVIEPERDGELKPRPDPQRLQELAKPKDKGDEDEEEEKPLVNPKALKAKATPRIIELAKPREIPS